MSGLETKIRKGISKRVKDLEGCSRRPRKVIWQWYQKFIESGRSPESLLPKKRSPRNPYGKLPKQLERVIVKIFRRLSLNPQEIHFLLEEHRITNPATGQVPSRAGIVNIIKRYPIFKINSEEIVRYEKGRAGELGHIDVRKLKNVKSDEQLTARKISLGLSELEIF